MPFAELPPSLTAAPFTIDEAKRAGLSASRLRATDLDRSVWGIRRVGDATTDLRERCRSIQQRMPRHAFFSHTTAALLLGAPVPYWHEGQRELHITAPTPRRAPHAFGLTGHQALVLPGDVASVGPLAVSSPARTWCDLSTELALGDLVAAGDFLIHWRAPLTSIAELDSRMKQRKRRHGSALLDHALTLLNERAESAPESLVRVIIVESGLPAPSANFVIPAANAHEFRADLAFEEYRVIVEYQGDHHRDKDQWRKDMSRRSELESRGWVVIEVNADDLRDPPALVARITRSLRRQGYRG